MPAARIASKRTTTAVRRTIDVRRRGMEGKRVGVRPVAGRRSAPTAGVSHAGRSAFDQTHFAGPRALRGILGRELHPLSLAQQFEHGAPDGAAVEEMLDTTLVAEEPEALVD